MAPTADSNVGEAIAEQMRTDELRELLERYPDLDRPALGRLRELYRAASATDVMAIMGSSDLSHKARRLEADESDDGTLIIAGLILLSALTVLAMTLA